MLFNMSSLYLPPFSHLSEGETVNVCLQYSVIHS